MWRTMYHKLRPTWAIRQSFHQCKPVFFARYHSLAKQVNTNTLLTPLTQIRFLAQSSVALTSSTGNDEEFDEVFDSDSYVLDPNEPDSFKTGEQRLLSNAAVRESYGNGNNENSLAVDLAGFTNVSQVLELCSKRETELLPRQCVEILSTLAKMSLDKQLRNNDIGGLLNRMDDLNAQMTASEIIFCLIYLNKIELGLHNDLTEKMFLRVQGMMRSDNDNMTIQDISRYLTLVKMTTNKYKSYHIWFETIPRVVKYLTECQSIDDLHDLIIPLQHLNKVITNDVWQIFQNILQKVISDERNFEFEHHKLLEILIFLNRVRLEPVKTLNRKILLMLKPKLPHFDDQEMVLVWRAYENCLEPSEILWAIEEAAALKMAKQPSLNLVACCSLRETPDARVKLKHYLEKFLVQESETMENVHNNPILYRVLRELRISDKEVLDNYWDAITKQIKMDHQHTTAASLDAYSAPKRYLSRLTHNYSYYNNNLSGTYHHRNFEQLVTRIFMHDLKNGMSKFLPSRFAKHASFVISYGGSCPAYKELPNLIADKVESMAEQFSITDCLLLSRAMHICYRTRYLPKLKTELMDSIYRINNALNSCTERHLEKPDLTLNEFNSILRAFHDRRTSSHTPLFEKLIDKLEELFSKDDLILDSWTIRSTIYNTYASKYILPVMIDKILNYVHDNCDYVSGDTMSKVLHCFYKLGYDPSVSENASHIDLHVLANAIQRDFDYMNGTAIVRSCLALCYFRALPYDLLDRLFHIDFISRLEDEMKLCYSKLTFPKLILNNIMQLNRAVCFEYPEARIPWFQQNYVEAQISKLPVKKNRFYMDIQRKLLTFVREDKFLNLDHVTPYGYRIEFVLHLDRDRNFVTPMQENERKVDVLKIAILPVQQIIHRRNNGHSMSGIDLLKERHLQILGYHVISITYSEWNSMYMNIPGAKLDYLKEKLALN